MMTEYFEYTVNRRNADRKGNATVASICADIINATGKTMRQGKASKGTEWTLVNSAFEIDDRPRVGDTYVVSVWDSAESKVKCNKCVRVTNGENEEIGRGTTEWCLVDMATRKPVSLSFCFNGDEAGKPCVTPLRISPFKPDVTVDNTQVRYSLLDLNGHINTTKCIGAFYNLLPQDVKESSLPQRIDINFKALPDKSGDLRLGMKKKNDEEYLFVATNSDDVVCSARLRTD